MTGNGNLSIGWNHSIEYYSAIKKGHLWSYKIIEDA